ncbi:hypothetical protein SAMN05660226_03528 [Parapedobacter luteus]|uniref:Uncharacterized protein n=1 Tax=Parapedobacter luteus TaxID=623280 RepID=A0A1T5ETL6_9SPHI|nr:hypothetical protein [Parapedobacter luteus]SKB87129.1 hypothetical protein SAMN05660226_03528 [Parapedobacter luteus]
MKTLLDNLQMAEDCLLGHASDEQRLLFEASLLLYPALREDVHWQRKTYHIIRAYGRQRLRHELEAMHRTLFTAPRHRAFRDKVLRIFQQR